MPCNRIAFNISAHVHCENRLLYMARSNFESAAFFLRLNIIYKENYINESSAVSGRIRNKNFRRIPV